MNDRASAEWSAAQQQWPPHGAPYPNAPAPRTSLQSIAVLVLGVASLTVFWGVAGIVALILAPGAKREIAVSGGAVGGAGLVRAGVICSWISIALTVLALAVIALFLFAFGTTSQTFTTPSGTGVALLVPAQ
ncbi:MAG: hypothetical protein ACT4QG_03245 [Sporichthyaceae bacterium]